MKVAIFVPHISDGNTTPSLGPLYLLGVLERDGFDGRLFDARIDKGALRKLLDFAPDVVGISCVTPAYPGGLRAAAAVKERYPETPVVLGGAHPSSLPRESVSEESVDYVLVGESEKTFPTLCRHLRDGDTSQDSLSSVNNLASLDGGDVVLTETAPLLSGDELDALPWPAFDLMDLDIYFASTQAHGLFHKGTRILPMMTGRGCPQTCTFCCRMMGHRIRSRSVDSVLDEARSLVDRYGVDELYFEDDNFTIQRARALEVLDRMASLTPPVYLKFANGLRADRVDRELLEAMKQARVYSLSFGIESGCETTLKRMKKVLDLDRARENVLLAKSMGFLVGSNCIVGYPGETASDIDKSLDFFLRLPLDSMAIVNLVPFPGTEVRALCEKEGYLTEAAGDWSNYYFSLNDPIPLIETPQLSAQDLVDCVHRAYRRMYMRPRWLLRSLQRLSIRQIVQGARIMFSRRI